MGMGIPIVLGAKGESAKIISDYEVGLIFKPENYKELANNIIYLRNDKDLIETFKSNGIKGAKKFDRKLLAKKMLKIIYEVKSTKI